MSTEVFLPSAATSERLSVDIETTGDPTGNAVAFQLTALSAQPATGAAWIAGTWVGSWVAPTAPDENSVVEAATPLTGATGFTLTQSSDLSLWVRFTVGTETVIRRAGKVHVR